MTKLDFTEVYRQKDSVRIQRENNCKFAEIAKKVKLTSEGVALITQLKKPNNSYRGQFNSLVG